MLTLIGPSSRLRFTSLSQTSVPRLKTSLASHPECSKAHAHTEPIMALVEHQEDQHHSASSSSTATSSVKPTAQSPFHATASPQVPFHRVCLLDPKAPQILSPADAGLFDCFLYGGILGDDPPRDRTAELRRLGFEGRHLGEKQMTTDTAVGVTKMVVEDGGESRNLLGRIELERS